MAAVSLFWESNMAALTLCENTLLNTISSYDIKKVVPDRGRLIHCQELRAKRVVVTFSTFKTSIFHWIPVLALFIHFRHGLNTFSQLRYRNRAEVTLLIHTYIHTYTLFMLEIYRVAVELISSRNV